MSFKRGEIELKTNLFFINKVIVLYHEGQFAEMKGLIYEYGEENFFRDLFECLESNVWRKYENKYLTFVGITIQFFKIYI